MSISRNPFDPVGGMTVSDYVRDSQAKIPTPQFMLQGQQTSIMPTEAQEKRDLRERVFKVLMSKIGSDETVDDVLARAKKVVSWIEDKQD